MKKLAILGASNAIRRDGYASNLKRRFPEDLDVYAIGSSSSLLAVFVMLQHQIVNRYEYVLLDFNIHDSDSIYHNWMHRQIIVAYLLFIIKQFYNSDSRLLFLLLPYRSVPKYASAAYIYKALAKIFNISVIDIEDICKFIDDEHYGIDAAHPCAYLQDFIANLIWNQIKSSQPLNDIELKDIEFSLVDFCEDIKLSQKMLGSSWLMQECVELNKNNYIQIPAQKYVCGIFFFTEEANPYLHINTGHMTIEKNLNIANYTHAFMARSIGYTCLNGIGGGRLTIGQSLPGCFYEYTAHEALRPSASTSQRLYIADMLVANRPPYHYGNEFLWHYRDVFKYELMKQFRDYLIVEKIRENKFVRQIYNFGEKAEIMISDILNSRPDVASAFVVNDDVELSLMPVYIVLWCWANGYAENESVNGMQSHLQNILRVWYKTKVSFAKIDSYRALLHLIYLIRQDLHSHNIYTKKGQIEVVRWFNDFGVGEYRLQTIIC